MFKSAPKLFVISIIVIFTAASAIFGGVTGGLDRTFDSDGKLTTVVSSAAGLDSARNVAVQADGKIVVVGQATDGATDMAIVRYNRNGTLDTTFDSDGKVTIDFFGSTDDANTVVILSDGKILVGGYATQSTQQRFVLVRLNPNGSLDTTFDGDGKAYAIFTTENAVGIKLLVQDDGKYLLGGRVGISPNLEFAAARFNTDGTLDTSFDTDGRVTLSISTANDTFWTMALQNNQRILLIGGTLAASISNSNWVIARLLQDGSLDPAWDTDGIVTTDFTGNSDIAFGVDIQPNNRIVISGSAANPNSDMAVARYLVDGSLDTSFDTDGKQSLNFGGSATDSARSVFVQPDGSLILAGQSNVGLTNDFALIKYSSTGVLDGTFNGGTGRTLIDFGGFSDVMNNAVMGPDGKILIVGPVELTSGNNDFGIARVNTVTKNAPFDYDGDEKADVSIYRPSLGQWWLNRSTTGTLALTFGVSTDKMVPADYTGDSKTDVGFFRPSTGEWYILRSEDFSFYAAPFGVSTDVPVPGDYDGDGKADIAVFRPSSSTWFINNSGGGSTISAFGATGDVPVAADYDGDNRTDIAIYRPSLGQWWLNRSTAGTIAMTFGTSTDKTVQGDYTGDGKADAAFWRPSTGSWFILRSEDFSFYGFPFGASTDVPTPGDFDGDGQNDSAVFRPSNSTWFINGTTAGNYAVPFGATGDLPTPNAYVR